MLPRFELGHFIGMAFLTNATHHQAPPDRILGRCMVAPVAVNTCHPMLSHWAFPPGHDKVRIDPFMATDTDSIILLGRYTLEVQREKDRNKPYRIDPTTTTSPFHKPSSLIFWEPTEKKFRLIIHETHLRFKILLGLLPFHVRFLLPMR